MNRLDEQQQPQLLRRLQRRLRARARQGYHRLLDDLEMRCSQPLATGARVLEVGCGTGLILGRLARRAPSAWGIDLSPGMLRGARARAATWCSAAPRSCRSRTPASIWCAASRCWRTCPTSRGALSRDRARDAPGGRMVLEFYNPWSLRYLAKRIAGPQPISDGRNEADVFTRWDSPLAIARCCRDGVELEALRGVRVFTPAAFVHKVPLVRDAFAELERRALASPLRYFGGFLIAILRKRDRVFRLTCEADRARYSWPDTHGRQEQQQLASLAKTR